MPSKTLKSVSSGADDLTSAQAKFALAGMQLKQGKTDEAKANYEAILSNSDAKYLQPMSLVALGDIAAAAGDDEKAKEYYQRKLDDYGEYADQNIAVTRLNLVGVDAPEKVSPPPAPEPSTNPNEGIPSSFTNPVPSPGASVTPGSFDPSMPPIVVAPAPAEGNDADAKLKEALKSKRPLQKKMIKPKKLPKIPSQKPLLIQR